MKIRVGEIQEIDEVLEFYWDLIEKIKDRNDSVGWKKGVYPTEEFIKDSIIKKELYLLKEEDDIKACVIVNNKSNDGYKDIDWEMTLKDDEIIIPHLLAVKSDLQGKGIGKEVVKDLVEFAKIENKKAIRLDILCDNTNALKLYESLGFKHIVTKDMYYADTGWTKFSMYELIIK